MQSRSWTQYPCFYSNRASLSFHLLMLRRSPNFMVSWPKVYNFKGIDENMVWKSGISVLEAKNHFTNSYNQSRVSLMFLMVTLLSQPLFHAPDEYLVILNPFATYFTSRRCKNVKNLYVSLINLVISYDTKGYVSVAKHLPVIGYSVHECNRRSGWDRNANHSCSTSNTDTNRVQATKHWQSPLSHLGRSPHSKQSIQWIHRTSSARESAGLTNDSTISFRRFNN